MEELERKPKGNLLRKLKRRERAGLYNVLRSIYEDSLFVRELREDILPGIPVLANLETPPSRRSSGSRTASQGPSRSGAECLNRAVAIARGEGDDRDWDREVHLPSWIPDSERSALEPLVEGWSQKLAKTQPGLLEELSEILAKPLRPLWVSDDSPMWQHVTREDRDGFSFVPVYLLCCSKLGESPRTSADKFTRHSWRYIRGAADDHEAWAAGLTPQMFWSHHEELLETDPEEVERTVEEIASREGLQYGAGFGGKRLSQKITSCSCGPDGGVVGRREVLGAVVLDCSTSRAVPADVGADVRHVEILPHKFDRLSLQNALGGATTYIAERLGAGCKVIVACDDGQDISPAVVAAHFLVSRTGT
ncbi:initiator tRNA phosphoribosyl transferase [Chloropicon roscoffensis]|uniref:Initiator tRNA phosphoribosyl transferase n=1 Tax=Chloropicon roscoffensis TaxID=1461544 RepID=A0AAX4PIX7_9CHLO